MKLIPCVLVVCLVCSPCARALADDAPPAAAPTPALVPPPEPAAPPAPLPALRPPFSPTPPAAHAASATLGVLGGLTLLVGVILPGYGAARANGASSAPSVEERDARIEEGRRLNFAGNVMLGVGAPIGVISVVVGVVPRVAPAKSETALWIAPAGAGLVLGGAF